jgi:DNA topoisomerase-1
MAKKRFTVNEIDELHADPQRCAKVAGLAYITGDEPGLGRVRKGKGFSYRTTRDKPLTDATTKARIIQLAIPPAWEDVWICPDDDGHILATGHDERGRKQYIYHPRWRAVRDMLNFYRLILFANHLSEIRQHVSKQLRRRQLDQDRVLAAMIRIIDESFIRIGNESYAEENDSYGLTTLTPEHVQVHGSKVSFSFPAKSGKAWDVTFADAAVARVVRELQDQRGNRLFTVDGHPIASEDLNRLLLELTGEHITAKDFRTWGGTLAAFSYLEERLAEELSQRAAEKVALAAIDEAADALGNTRTVARAHYVHPHVLHTYTEHTFGDYLARSRPRKLAELEPAEQRLAGFLAELFDTEFSLLTSKDS